MKKKNRPDQTVGDQKISPEPDIPDAEILDENLTICLREDMSVDMEPEECEILSDDEYFLDDNPTLNLTDEMTITSDGDDEEAIVLGDDDYFMDDCPTLNLTDEMAVLTGRTDLLSTASAPAAIPDSEPENESGFFLDIRELKDDPEIENTWDEFLKNSQEGFDHPTIQLLPPAVVKADFNPFDDKPDFSEPESSVVPDNAGGDNEADINVFPEAETPPEVPDDTEAESGTAEDDVSGLPVEDSDFDVPPEPDVPDFENYDRSGEHGATDIPPPGQTEDDVSGLPATDSDFEVPPEPDVPDFENYDRHDKHGTTETSASPKIPSVEEDTETLGPPDTSDLVPETEEVTIELNPATVIGDRPVNLPYNGQDATLELSVHNIIEAEPDFRMDDWAGGGMADEDYTFDLPPRNVVDIKQVSRREPPWHYMEDDPTFDRPPGHISESAPEKTPSVKDDDSTLDLPDQDIIKPAEDSSPDDDQPFELTSQNIVGADEPDDSSAGNWASDIDPEMYGNTIFGVVPDTAGDRTLELPVQNIVAPEPDADDEASFDDFPDSIGDHTLELPMQNIVAPEPGADDETAIGDEPDSDEDQAIDIPLQDIVPPDAAGDPTLDLPEQSIAEEKAPDNEPDSDEDQAIDIPVQDIIPETSADRTLDLPEQDMMEPESVDNADPVEDIMAAISSIGEIIENERNDIRESPAGLPPEPGPDDDTVVSHTPEIPEHEGEPAEDRSPEPLLQDMTEIPDRDAVTVADVAPEPAGDKTVDLSMQHAVAESPDSDTVVDLTLQEVPDPDSTTVQIPESDGTVDLKYQHILETAGDESPETSGLDTLLENLLGDDADPDATTVRLPETDETPASRFDAYVALADDEDEEEITLVMPQREIPGAAETKPDRNMDVDAETIVIPFGDGDELSESRVPDEDADVPDAPDSTTVQIPEPDSTVDLEYHHIPDAAGDEPDESPETTGFDMLLENLLKDDTDPETDETPASRFDADVALADDEDEEEITLVMPQRDVPGVTEPKPGRNPDIDAETIDIPFGDGDELPEIRFFDEDADAPDDSFTDGSEYPAENTLAIDRDARTLFVPGKTDDAAFPATPAITDTGDDDSDDAEEPFMLTSDNILEPDTDTDELTPDGKKSFTVSGDEEEEETLVLSSRSFTDTSDAREEDTNDPDTFDLEKAVEDVLKLETPEEEAGEPDADDSGDAEALDAATAFLLDDDEIAGMIHTGENDLSGVDTDSPVSSDGDAGSDWQDQTLVLDEATVIQPKTPEPEEHDRPDEDAGASPDWRDRTLVLDEATVIRPGIPESEEDEGPDADLQDRTLVLDEATIIQPNIPKPEADLQDRTLVLDEKTVVRPLTPDSDDLPDSSAEPSPGWPDSTLVLDEATVVHPGIVPDKPAELLTEDEEDDDVLDLDAGTIIAFRQDGEIDIDAAIENALNDEEEQTLVLEDEQDMASQPEIPDPRHDDIDENILDLDARTLVAPGEPEIPVRDPELKTAKALMEEDDVVTLDPGTMILSRQDMFPDNDASGDTEVPDFLAEYEGSTEHVPDTDMPGLDLDEAVSDALGREHDEPGESGVSAHPLSRNLLSSVLLNALQADDSGEPPVAPPSQPEGGVTAIELLDGLEEVPDEPAGTFQEEDDFLSMLEKEIQASGSNAVSEISSSESVASRTSSGIQITCNADISGIKSLVKDSASNVIGQRRFEGLVSPEKLEQMLERVIERIFVERIEKMLGNAIEKSVQDEIRKVRKFLLEEIAIEEGD